MAWAIKRPMTTLQLRQTIENWEISFAVLDFPRGLKPNETLLADSLAGLGRVCSHRSRDICEKERKKKVHQIIREEYYIECTCGYKGPAFHGMCPKCRPNEIFIPLLRFHP